jgi:hypothetical protein
MDDTELFMELSALLTGLYGQLLHDPEGLAANSHIAEEYARRLRGTYPESFPALLDAYKTLVTVDPKPPVDDALLAKLRETPQFKDNKELVARQIVNIWYFSQFNDESGEVLDGGFYEHGAVWPIVKAHPIGFSAGLHGYWSQTPE